MSKKSSNFASSNKKKDLWKKLFHYQKQQDKLKIC